MTKRILRPVDYVGLTLCAALITPLTGCIVAGTDQHPRHQPRTQVVVSYEDDYDYYPRYEVYYSRSRHEYVYLDGNAWVRRSEPRGISIDLLLATPSVRMDFRDSPEKHHNTVIRSYPKNHGQSDHQPAEKGKNRKGKNKKHGHDNEKDDHK